MHTKTTEKDRQNNKFKTIHSVHIETYMLDIKTHYIRPHTFTCAESTRFCKSIYTTFTKCQEY